jgi:hypothetical protein
MEQGIDQLRSTSDIAFELDRGSAQILLGYERE